MPALAIRSGRIHESNASAHGLFARIHVGMAIEELFDESCREKVRRFLEEPSGATNELLVRQVDRPPVAARFLLLEDAGEHLLVTGGSGLGYTEEIGAKLMAANSELTTLTRELSRQMRELAAAKQVMLGLADLRELFIAVLAHDLKAPLSVILLNEALLRRKAPSLQTIEIERHVDKVERTTKRMLQLTDSLLLAARLDSTDSGRLDAESLEPLSIDELAREAVDDVATLAEEAGVRIVTTLEEIRVQGNRAWLGRVFANLLTNAIRHSPAGTRIDVTVAAAGSDARCDVADQGPGIPPADRERIFDRFVQRGEQPGSIGLGLYICRKIMALHGGRIWIEDNPGGGARFAFRIPRAAGTEARA